MTDFDKEKAEAQAEAWFPLSPNNIKYYRNDVKQDYFIKGARWQAKQPIEITDKMVERGVTVYRNNEHYFDDYDTLRIAIKAALGVANES